MPKAFVVVKEHIIPSPIIAQSIKDFVAARKSSYKKLAGGLDFVDAIPKNPSGKILRRILRDQEKAKKAKAKL